MPLQTGAPAASSTNKPCSWQHQHAHCAASVQRSCLHAAGRAAARIRAQAAAADAAVTTIRPADIQPVQCLKEWAPVCAALGDGLQTVGALSPVIHCVLKWCWQHMTCTWDMRDELCDALLQLQPAAHGLHTARPCISLRQLFSGW
jgi:hypothetical protein